MARSVLAGLVDFTAATACHKTLAWSDQEIARAITHGIGRDGRLLKPPMGFAYYAALREADLADIIAYLRTVPPLQ